MSIGATSCPLTGVVWNHHTLEQVSHLDQFISCPSFLLSLCCAANLPHHQFFVFVFPSTWPLSRCNELSSLWFVPGLHNAGTYLVCRRIHTRVWPMLLRRWVCYTGIKSCIIPASCKKSYKSSKATWGHLWYHIKCIQCSLCINGWNESTLKHCLSFYYSQNSPKCSTDQPCCVCL